MAWRKQSPAPARPPGGNSRAVESSSRLPEFCHGLYPILLQGDPEAFRYLTQWEDVIGDTAEMEATSADQLRAPWPPSCAARNSSTSRPGRCPPGAPRGSTPKGGHARLRRGKRRWLRRLSTPTAQGPAPLPGRPAHPAPGPPRPQDSPQRARPHSQAVPPAPPPSIHPRPDDPAPGGVYQLDMVTGEARPHLRANHGRGGAAAIRGRAQADQSRPPAAALRQLTAASPSGQRETPEARTVSGSARATCPRWGRPWRVPQCPAEPGADGYSSRLAPATDKGFSDVTGNDS